MVTVLQSNNLSQSLLQISVQAHRSRSPKIEGKAFEMALDPAPCNGEVLGCCHKFSFRIFSEGSLAKFLCAATSGLIALCQRR
jgi:hypothetical protein